MYWEVDDLMIIHDKRQVQGEWPLAQWTDQSTFKWFLFPDHIETYISVPLIRLFDINENVEKSSENKFLDPDLHQNWISSSLIHITSFHQVLS